MIKIDLWERQDRLRRIAKRLKERASLSDADYDFLATALKGIANGEDANQALEAKAKRGEKKSQDPRIAKTNMTVALLWIAAARRPAAEGGLGLSSYEEACALLAGIDNPFGLTEATLKNYWDNNGDHRNIEMPIQDEEFKRWRDKKGVAGQPHELTQVELDVLRPKE